MMGVEEGHVKMEVGVEKMEEAVEKMKKGVAKMVFVGVLVEFLIMIEAFAMIFAKVLIKVSLI